MQTVVDLRSGAVRGRLVDGVHEFRGIPYAAPPFGPRRLRPPQPVPAWYGVREALTWGAKPPSPSYRPPWDGLLPELDAPGEDCLTLNVWAPDVHADGLPVMVWIPGGVFEHGTAACDFYDGGRFARDGVVLVSINYRVGAEGFACLEGGAANLGLLDQIAALEWVRDNVAAVGGDPGNVTVFGQSAGGLSIGTLLAVPRAQGLFRRAVVQSGGGHYVLPADDARKVARALAEHLGVAPTREGMAAVPPGELVQAQEQLKDALMADPDPQRWGRQAALRRTLWSPVVDGDLLPARPVDRIAAGAGAAQDEWHFFLAPTPGAFEAIPPELPTAVAEAWGLPVEQALAAYRAERPGAGPGELFAAIQGDAYFRIRTLQLAEAHAPGTGSTYMYEFAWHSPAYGGRLGACYGLDVPFVFDTLVPGDPLVGPDPPQQLAEAMHAAWVAFATTGDPGWPRYDLERRTTMRFDTASGVVDDPRAAVRGLWENGHG